MKTKSVQAVRKMCRILLQVMRPANGGGGLARILRFGADKRYQPAIAAGPVAAQTVTPLDPILFRELPVIRKIIDDETWLEGERRGCRVERTDPVVRENVCLVILRIGAELRKSLMQAGPEISAEAMAEAPAVTTLNERHQAA